jgi:hypothetical protein
MKKFNLKLPDSLIPTHIPICYYGYNLGDDIQSEAACRFFNIRSHVNRDVMSTWPKNSLVPFIGWYGYNYSFDTSKQALLISTHISSSLYKKISSDQVVINWLKSQIRNQGFPALCRDISTRDFFRSIGLDAEFHGCITSSLESKGFKKERLVAIDVKQEDRLSDYEFLTQLDINYSRLTPEKRLEKASERIDLLDSSKNVVTSRLHVYLPCKALSTEVELITDPSIFDVSGRFGGHI